MPQFGPRPEPRVGHGEALPTEPPKKPLAGIHGDTRVLMDIYRMVVEIRDKVNDLQMNLMPEFNCKGHNHEQKISPQATFSDSAFGPGCADNTCHQHR